MYTLCLISVGMPLADWWRMLHRRLTMALMMNSPRHLSSAVWLAVAIFYDEVAVSGIAKTGNAKLSVTAETEGQATQGTKTIWKLNKQITAGPAKLMKHRIGGVTLCGLDNSITARLTAVRKSTNCVFNFVHKYF